jgi:hypothetical protein
MNQPIDFKTTIPFITKSTMHSGAVMRCGIIAVLLVCFGLLPKGQTVNPPPDGGYPGGNTAEGQNALLSLTSGIFNANTPWHTPIGPPTSHEPEGRRFSPIFVFIFAYATLVQQQTPSRHGTGHQYRMNTN